ncbi:hypothetical protein SUGI_0519540 [Cryptomeria japonica]|nr:hypothetical protein SUGI_0519540 [Cryptomeria japonica]
MTIRPVRIYSIQTTPCIRFILTGNCYLRFKFAGAEETARHAPKKLFNFGKRKKTSTAEEDYVFIKRTGNGPDPRYPYKFPVRRWNESSNNLLPTTRALKSVADTNMQGESVVKIGGD